VTAAGTKIDVIQEEVTETGMIDIAGIKSHETMTDPQIAAALAIVMTTVMTTDAERAETTTDVAIVTNAVEVQTGTNTDPADETPTEMKAVALTAVTTAQEAIEMMKNQIEKKKNKFNQENS
jgi:hypothetical protein